MSKLIFHRSALLVLVALIAVFALAACGSDTTSAVSTNVASVPTLSSPVSYAKDIDPILQNSCFNCHGGERTSRALSVATYDTLMKGSQNGAVVIAGDPDNSKLLQSILSGKMPKKGDKLTAEQIQLIRQWIAEGAQNN
jgi:mono/diheme cytochrome c family protein